eukprot:6871770-Pyramimonas_sp.AAC.1
MVSLPAPRTEGRATCQCVRTVERTGPRIVVIDLFELLLREFGIQHVAHVIDRAVVHFVAVRQNVHLSRERNTTLVLVS